MDFNTTKTATPTSGVPLFAVATKPLAPSELLTWADFTLGIPENNPEYNIYERILPISGKVEYMLPDRFREYYGDTLLVTDRTVESIKRDTTTPLFLQYQPMFDAYIMDPSLPDGFTIVRKNFESVIDFDNYIIETRSFRTISGRYTANTTGGFIWTSSPVSGKVTTFRVLLPAREKDNFYTLEYNKHLKESITEHWNELMETPALYENGTDYSITASSILLSASTRMASGVPIYVQRNLSSFITLQPPTYNEQDTQTCPWYPALNCGAFTISSGLYSGYEHFKIDNYNTGSGTVIEESPRKVHRNIIRTSVFPLSGSASGYPSYGFNDVLLTLEVNGRDVLSSVRSMDTDNGYIYLAQNISEKDNVRIEYLYDDTQIIVGKTLNLNPMHSVNSSIYNISLAPISGTPFEDHVYLNPLDFTDLSIYDMGLAPVPGGGPPYEDNVYINLISSNSGTIISAIYNMTLAPASGTTPPYQDNVYLNPVNSLSGAFDAAVYNVGLAIVPSGTVFYDNTYTPVNWSYVAYFNFGDNQDGDFSAGTTTGYAFESKSDNYIAGPISGLIPSGSHLLGYFSINPITKDMLSTYDLRRLGGYTGLTPQNTSGWLGFTDLGYWDGEPFPKAGTLLIQIPSGVYTNVYALFNKSTDFNKLDTMYSPDLEKVINRDTQVFNSREQKVLYLTNKYIRDVIERYLPCGFNYIVMNEDFELNLNIRSES